MSFTPGPSALFAISQGIRVGFWQAIPSLLGNLVASITYGLLSAFGVGYFLLENPQLLKNVVLIGATYLIFMGLSFFLQKNNQSFFSVATTDKIVTVVKRSIIKDFLNGFIVNLSNPKIMLFYLIVIPQFSSNSDTVMLPPITLALIQNVMKAGSLVVYSIFAYKLRNWLGSVSNRAIQKFSGLIIVIAGLILIVDSIQL